MRTDDAAAAFEAAGDSSSGLDAACSVEGACEKMTGVKDLMLQVRLAGMRRKGQGKSQ